ncbi:MAG TPA: response regulator [Acetobacteraceae bacterium]|nr:response regulator [Acetobacteraceae bacterium]
MPERKHVLVVEDDPLVAEIVVDSLSDDYAVEHAADARNGLALLQRGSFDLMLLDCTLPGGLGQELVPAADRARVPVLLMSGNPERAREVPGERPFLLKPFSLSDLLDRVAGLMRR